jgi:hypothetical protein
MVELCTPSERNQFNPPVKSHLIRQHGAARGVRLVAFDSLMNFIAGCGVEGGSK